MPVVLIPAYRPGPSLLRTLADLRGARPTWSLVVVDDGSGTAYDARFRAARSLGASVVTLPSNEGKGAGLKAGLRHVLAAHPGEAVVTADADGQHAVPDIVRVGEAVREDMLVLGAREFDAQVPLRSRLGNLATRWLFAAATRRRLTDTQTGLRAIPASLLAWAVDVPGTRYEFEIQMLLHAARAGIRVEEVAIATIYVDDNASSHFRPLQDSVRIYLPLLAFLGSAASAFVLDTAALLALQAVGASLLVSVIVARLLSAGLNFQVNRRLVFDRQRRCRTRVAMVRYAALAALLLVFNYVLLLELTALGAPLAAAKVATEVLLLCASFTTQQRFVFASQEAHRTSPSLGQPTPSESSQTPRRKALR